MSLVAKKKNELPRHFKQKGPEIKLSLMKMKEFLGHRRASPPRHTLASNIINFIESATPIPSDSVLERGIIPITKQFKTGSFPLL